MNETAKEGRLYALFGKALLLFAAAFVMLCINPRTAHAADIYASGDGWELDTDGHLTIFNQEGMEAFVERPVTYYYVKSVTVEQGVTSIPDRAFRAYYELTTITLSDSVTEIGERAFHACLGLTSITIPDSVTSIGESAFDTCESLTSITIPDSVTSIGEYAFSCCSSLTSITIPDSMTEIGANTFSQCESLTSITIPDSVTSIGDSAFNSCSSLTSITIPDSVTSIEEYAFSCCSSLTSITIPASVTSIGQYAFFYCSSLTSIAIPDSVTEIGAGTFSYCESLTSITIPAGVTKIGLMAFENCSSLKEVTMLGTSVPIFPDYRGVGVFAGTAFVERNEKGIRVPMKALNDYMTSNVWSDWREYIYGYNVPLNFDPTAEDYADTDIDVLGFTRDAIVYSVDVEWGAMTFQYENSTWDATEHKTVTGAGWKVYDSENNKALDSTTDPINRIQVTNHSNASVWATLKYDGAADYKDTTGSFDTEEGDTVTDFDVRGNYLFLDTANNAEEKGGEGTPTVGTVYFMPSGIKEEYKKADGITKWSQLGTITVGIVTEEP